MALACLEDYDFSPKTGLLPEDPLTQLPEYFGPWEDIARTVGEHVENGTFGALIDMIEQMPLLDEDKLQTFKERTRANTVLSFLLHGYVWGRGDATDAPRLVRVPRQLAVPFCRVADSLGMPYVATYFSLFLNNYQFKDPELPVDPSNIDHILALPGGEEARWFLCCNVFVDYKASAGIQAFAGVQNGVTADNKESVLKGLETVHKSLSDMISATDRFYENAGEIFVKLVKPFITGWGGEISSAPDGVVFEGVSDNPYKLRGVAAAESVSLYVFDALLGVTHEKDLAAFVDNILPFVLPSHRKLVSDVRAGPSVRQYVIDKADSGLTSVYNACVTAVTDFRSTHIQLVTRFGVNPMQKAINEGRQTKFDYSAAEVMVFLKKFRDSTAKSRLDN